MKIGIDVGGSHIAVGSIYDGKVIEKIERKLQKEDKENIIEYIEENIINLSAELQRKNSNKITSIEFEKNARDKGNTNKQIEKIFSKNNELEEIESIGIAIPGTVKDETVIRCVNLKIENYNLVEEVTKRINNDQRIKVSKNLKIKLINDANAAAIAENKYGAIKNAESSIFITLGTGIGGAAFLENKLLKTGNFPGFEFGHTTIDCQSKNRCKCGKYGCFEQYASMRVFKTNMKNALNLEETVHGKELYDIIKDNLANNNNLTETNKVIDDFVKYLSIGLSNLINIFEPDVIGIGGSFVHFYDFMLDRIYDCLKNENLLFNKRNDIIIKPAVLGNDAGMIGASIVAES